MPVNAVPAYSYGQLCSPKVTSVHGVTALLALWLRRPSLEWKILCSNPVCARIFLGSRHSNDLKIGTPVATLPGAWCYRVSAGTGCLVSVYCDWVRWKVWSATCISVWQHIKLLMQIHAWYTLTCCWDVKQPTNCSWWTEQATYSEINYSHSMLFTSLYLLHSQLAFWGSPSWFIWLFSHCTGHFYDSRKC